MLQQKENKKFKVSPSVTSTGSDNQQIRTRIYKTKHKINYYKKTTYCNTLTLMSCITMNNTSYLKITIITYIKHNIKYINKKLSTQIQDLS